MFTMCICDLFKDFKVISGRIRKIQNIDETRIFCRRFWEKLDSFLETSKGDLGDRVSGLELAIETFTNHREYLEDCGDVDELFSVVFMTCARLILSLDWQNLADDDCGKESFIATIGRCQPKLEQYNHVQIVVLSQLITAQWSEPVLTQIMACPEEELDREQVSKYLFEQYPDILRLRLSLLMENGCEEFALNFASWISKLNYFSQDTDVLQKYLTLLIRQDQRDMFHKKCSRVLCHTAVEIIQCVRQMPGYEDVALIMAQTFLGQDLFKPTYYCCTKTLLTIWMELQHATEADHDTFTGSLKKMSRLCKDPIQLTYFAETLYNMFHDEYLSMCVALLVKAFKADAVMFASQKRGVKDINLLGITASLIHVCHLLSGMLRKHCSLISQLSMLTAFSLDPSEQLYSFVELLYSVINSSKLEEIERNDENESGSKNENETVNEAMNDSGDTIIEGENERTEETKNVELAEEVTNVDNEDSQSESEKKVEKDNLVDSGISEKSDNSDKESKMDYESADLKSNESDNHSENESERKTKNVSEGRMEIELEGDVENFSGEHYDKGSDAVVDSACKSESESVVDNNETERKSSEELVNNETNQSDVETCDTSDNNDAAIRIEGVVVDVVSSDCTANEEIEAHRMKIDDEISVKVNVKDTVSRVMNGDHPVNSEDVTSEHSVNDNNTEQNKAGKVLEGCEKVSPGRGQKLSNSSSVPSSQFTSFFDSFANFAIHHTTTPPPDSDSNVGSPHASERTVNSEKTEKKSDNTDESRKAERAEKGENSVTTELDISDCETEVNNSNDQESPEKGRMTRSAVRKRKLEVPSPEAWKRSKYEESDSESESDTDPGTPETGNKYGIVIPGVDDQVLLELVNTLEYLRDVELDPTKDWDTLKEVCEDRIITRRKLEDMKRLEAEKFKEEKEKEEEEEEEETAEKAMETAMKISDTVTVAELLLRRRDIQQGVKAESGEPVPGTSKMEDESLAPLAVVQTELPVLSNTVLEEHLGVSEVSTSAQITESLNTIISPSKTAPMPAEVAKTSGALKSFVKPPVPKPQKPKVHMPKTEKPSIIKRIQKVSQSRIPSKSKMACASQLMGGVQTTPATVSDMLTNQRINQNQMAEGSPTYVIVKSPVCLDNQQCQLTRVNGQVYKIWQSKNKTKYNLEEGQRIIGIKPLFVKPGSEDQMGTAVNEQMDNQTIEKVLRSVTPGDLFNKIDGGRTVRDIIKRNEEQKQNLTVPTGSQLVTLTQTSGTNEFIANTVKVENDAQGQLPVQHVTAVKVGQPALSPGSSSIQQRAPVYQSPLARLQHHPRQNSYNRPPNYQRLNQAVSQRAKESVTSLPMQIIGRVKQSASHTSRHTPTVTSPQVTVVNAVPSSVQITNNAVQASQDVPTQVHSFVVSRPATQGTHQNTQIYLQSSGANIVQASPAISSLPSVGAVSPTLVSASVGDATTTATQIVVKQEQIMQNLQDILGIDYGQSTSVTASIVPVQTEADGAVYVQSQTQQGLIQQQVQIQEHGTTTGQPVQIMTQPGDVQHQSTTRQHVQIIQQPGQIQQQSTTAQPVVVHRQQATRQPGQIQQPIVNAQQPQQLSVYQQQLAAIKQKYQQKQQQRQEQVQGQQQQQLQRQQHQQMQGQQQQRQEQVQGLQQQQHQQLQGHQQQQLQRQQLQGPQQQQQQPQQQHQPLQGHQQQLQGQQPQLQGQPQQQVNRQQQVQRQPQQQQQHNVPLPGNTSTPYGNQEHHQLANPHQNPPVLSSQGRQIPATVDSVDSPSIQNQMYHLNNQIHHRQAQIQSHQATQTKPRSPRAQSPGRSSHSPGRSPAQQKTTPPVKKPTVARGYKINNTRPHATPGTIKGPDPETERIRQQCLAQNRMSPVPSSPTIPTSALNTRQVTSSEAAQANSYIPQTPPQVQVNLIAQQVATPAQSAATNIGAITQQNVLVSPAQVRTPASQTSFQKSVIHAHPQGTQNVMSGITESTSHQTSTTVSTQNLVRRSPERNNSVTNTNSQPGPLTQELLEHIRQMSNSGLKAPPNPKRVYERKSTPKSEITQMPAKPMSAQSQSVRDELLASWKSPPRGVHEESKDCLVLAAQPKKHKEREPVLAVLTKKLSDAVAPVKTTNPAAGRPKTIRTITSGRAPAQAPQQQQQQQQLSSTTIENFYLSTPSVNTVVKTYPAKVQVLPSNVLAQTSPLVRAAVAQNQILRLQQNRHNQNNS